MVTFAVTGELFLVALTYEVWECLKDIHFVFRRNANSKEVAFQKSLRLCDFASARKVSWDFLVKWDSAHAL